MDFIYQILFIEAIANSTEKSKQKKCVLASFHLFCERKVRGKDKFKVQKLWKLH